MIKNQMIKYTIAIILFSIPLATLNIDHGYNTLCFIAACVLLENKKQLEPMENIPEYNKSNIIKFIPNSYDYISH